MIQTADSFDTKGIMRQNLSRNGFQNSGRRDERNVAALQNPGKTILLRLASDVIREVAMVKWKDGVRL